MFRETVTSADGSTETSTCTEADALLLLRTAVRRGYTVEATRTGGAVITRDVHDGYHRAPRKHTVVIEPVTPAGKVTGTTRRDLEAIAGDGRARMNAGRIDASHGFYSIPPATARRLTERGLVTAGADGTVTVSLAARLAMLAQGHRTETREPRGYVHPSDIGRTDTAGLNKPGGRGGRVYDRSSVASCSCTWSYPAEDRDDARRRAHGHRQEMTAALVRELTGQTQEANHVR